MTSNPLLSDWTGAHGLPEFSVATPDRFRPAFDEALAAHRAEIDAIAAGPAPATFANTIEAIVLGANMLDATMAGLGRGAGNCPMELLVGFLLVFVMLAGEKGIWGTLEPLLKSAAARLTAAVTGRSPPGCPASWARRRNAAIAVCRTSTAVPSPRSSGTSCSQ